MNSPCYSNFKASKSVENFKWNPSGMYSPFHVYDDFYFKRDIKESGMPFNYATDPNRFHPLANCAQYVPGVGPRNQTVKGAMPMKVIDLNSDIRNQFRKASLCPSQKHFPNKITKPCKNDQKASNVNRFLEGFDGGAPYRGGPGHFGSLPNSKDSLTLANCDQCDKCNLGLPCNCHHCSSGLAHGPGMNPSMNLTGLQDCEKQLIPEETRPFGKACNLPGVFINRFEALCDNHQDPKTIDSNAKIGIDSRNIIKDSYSSPNLNKIMNKFFN